MVNKIYFNPPVAPDVVRTVNLEIFARVLFSRMRSLVKLKPSWSGEITLPLTYIGKSWLCRDFFNVANMSFNNIRENEILAKIFEFTISFCCWSHCVGASHFVVWISVFMPPLFVECGRALSVAHVRPSVRLSVRPCVRPCVLPFVHHLGRYFVSVTPPTIFSQSVWNFTGVFVKDWRCAWHLDITFRLIFVTFFTVWT